MGRVAGQPERRSERKAAANRMNARRPRLASRRGESAQEEVLRRSLVALRELTPACVKLMRQLVAGTLVTEHRGRVTRTRVPIATQLQAAIQVLDRAGIPRQCHHAVGHAELPVKLIDLTGWDPHGDTPPTHSTPED